jgi:hypothetical protein
VKDEAKALLIQLASTTKQPDNEPEVTDMDISTVEEKPTSHDNENNGS